MTAGVMHPPDPLDAVFRSETLASLLRLRWFIHMRWVMVGGALAALALEQLITPDAQRPSWLLLVVLLTGATNLLWMLLSRDIARNLPIGVGDHSAAMVRARRFAIAQIATDLLLLTLILRFAGGIESVLAIFYLFHMGICALLLDARQALVQGVWAVFLFSSVGVGELVGWIQPHYDFLPKLRCTGAYAVGAYVLIAILVQALAVFGTLYFTLRIARRIGEQERQLRQALQALHLSQEAVKELQVRRARFMVTAAHQLKSPLAAIQTMATLIRDGYVSGDGLNATVQSIIRRSQDAIIAVGELITLARVQEADPRRHTTSTADVSAVVRRVGQRREAEARRKGLSFSIEVPSAHALTARIDPVDLDDCVDNLVGNAIKYTPGPGKVVVSARTGTAAPDVDEPTPASDWIEIEVADTGIGIAEVDLGDAQSRSANCSIFDAYRRGNTALEAGIPGSGLGLSIVREVVEQAGGDVRVRSQLGNGSVFTLRLRAATHPPPQPPATGDPADASALEAKILARVGKETNQP